MPSHRVHCYVDRQLFGKSYWRIHRRIDAPYLVLGRRHRVLFHDFASVVVISSESYPNDLNAFFAGLNHLYVDEACSRDPVFKAQLEFLAKRDVRERKRLKKGRRSPRKRRRMISWFKI